MRVECADLFQGFASPMRSGVENLRRKQDVSDFQTPTTHEKARFKRLGLRVCGERTEKMLERDVG